MNKIELNYLTSKHPPNLQQTIWGLVMFYSHAKQINFQKLEVVIFQMKSPSYILALQLFIDGIFHLVFLNGENSTKRGEY